MNIYHFIHKYCLARGVWIVRADTEESAWQIFAAHRECNKQVAQDTYKLVMTLLGENQTNGVIGCIFPC